jgi:hypothetical protein
LKKVIRVFLGLILTISFGCLIGWLSRPGARSSYLELQATSDTVHRFTLVTLPVLILLAIMSGVLAYIVRNRFRIVLVGLVAVSLAMGSGFLAYITGFDARLETSGLAGQFDLDQDAPPPTRLALVVPGPNDTLLFFGDGDYEDDVLIAAIDPKSGRRLWTYHCLGNRIFTPVVDETDLALSTWRPAGSSVALIHWREPTLIWSVRFDTEITLPPRFTSFGIEVATDNEVLLLERGSGRVLRRQPACGREAATGVACQAGRVVAWVKKETP